MTTLAILLLGFALGALALFAAIKTSPGVREVLDLAHADDGRALADEARAFLATEIAELRRTLLRELREEAVKARQAVAERLGG